ASTHDTILFFTDKGRVFALKAYEVPEVSRQAKGQAIINLINVEPKEEIQAVLTTASDLSSASEYLVLATQNGLVKKTKLAAFKNIRSSGIIAIHLTSQDRLIWVKQTSGNHHLMLVSRAGKAIRFHEKDVRPSGRNTKGVKGLRLKKDDRVIGMAAFPETPPPTSGRKKVFLDILVVTQKGLGKRTSVSEFPVHKRAGSGVKVAEVTGKTGPVSAAIPVDQRIQQVVITSKKAQVIKLPLKNIKRLHRASQGVILMRFTHPDDIVAAVTTISTEQTAP
ncbi:MAG: DNA gyrase subunit A, partial [Candidatus Chisholmbacteria bacterium]|nr:DNA gyrase subunit A [Candidatus Chisholmbacteria bacterium]